MARFYHEGFVVERGGVIAAKILSSQPPQWFGAFSMPSARPTIVWRVKAGAVNFFTIRFRGVPHAPT